MGRQYEHLHHKFQQLKAKNTNLTEISVKYKQLNQK